MSAVNRTMDNDGRQSMARFAMLNAPCDWCQRFLDDQPPLAEQELRGNHHGIDTAYPVQTVG